MCTIFVIKVNSDVKMVKKEKLTPLTNDEKELIRLLRLFHKAFPNGQNDIEWLIEKQVQKMLDRN